MSDFQSVLAAREREASESRAQRKARGIVHTPRELAEWALGRVAHALTRDLELSDGLSDARVCLLDPAVGTGVWLEAALAHVSRGGRLLGLDVDAGALASARRVLSAACAARDVSLALSEANTLELSSPWSASDEVRVIVGNPPWATRSLSRGSALSDTWLRDFMRDAHGEPLGERRAGVLSDDYVRFFRWALEQARTAPGGAVVCLATNNSFLDGPVHRGMRARLLETFQRIEVLDLGGNALIARSGVRDGNPFGVRVGACITLLVRRPDARVSCTVEYRRVLGSREEKLSALATLSALPSTLHTPTAPLLRFVPASGARAETPGFSLADAFPFHREGIQTNRDALVTDVDRNALETRLAALVAGGLPLAPSRHLDPAYALRMLREARERGEACIAELAYRPLETRFVCTVPPLCHRPRPELLRAMTRSSWALASVRKDRGGLPFHLFAPLMLPADSCFLSARSSCRTRVFPSHTPEGDENLSPPVRDSLAMRLGVAPTSSDVLAYALALLAAPSFREQAGDALKLDYPRLPWPGDLSAFRALVGAGLALRAALHDPLPDRPFEVEQLSPETLLAGRDVRLDATDGRIFLAGEAVLSGIPSRAFSATVGHYPLLAMALKKGRMLTISQLVHVVGRASMWGGAMETADLTFLARASV